MKKKLSALACALLGLGLLAPNAGANIINLTMTDTDHYVGLITPDAPADPADELTYLKVLIGMTPGTSCTDSSCAAGTGQFYHRSSLNSVPAADSTAPSITFSGTSWTVNIAGRFYLIGKYDAGNAGGEVYLVDVDLGDQVTVPAFFADNQYGLSGVNAFSTVSVPDGGTTVLLLGAGMLAIGIVRRSFAA